MLRIVLCFAILVLFSVRGAANPAVRRQCRAGVCDDRPVCPQSPCRCVYPSRTDCALYYQCVQGKPLQYRCSPGLLFNGDTLTCDYDFNVNCSIEKTTRIIESSTGGIITVSEVTTSEVPQTPTVISDDTTSDRPFRTIETSTEVPSIDASEDYSTEIYRTTMSNKYSSTYVTASESSDLSTGTVKTTLTDTQSESYSKSTNKDDTTTSDSFINLTKTSDFSTYTISDISLDTTDSKSSDFVTEATNPTPLSKQTEVSETTKSTVKEDKSTKTDSAITITEESEAPDTSKSIVTTKESDEEPEPTNPSSTTKEVEEPETTNPSSATKEVEEPETTNPSSTTKETETTSFSSAIATSVTASVNGSTRVTEHSLSTEEIQPEVTTDILNRNWTCPSRFGFYPDENNCSKFYHCSHWQPYHKSCPSNLHFNPVLQVCDWPENAGCDTSATSTTEYSDPTNDKVSEISSASSKTGVTQVTDFENNTMSSKIETENNINETTVTNNGLNTDTTFPAKTTVITAQDIITNEPTSRAEINSTFSITTDAATTDSKFTSENVSQNDELFSLSTQPSDNVSELTTITIHTDETSVTRRDYSTMVSSISPIFNATTYPESTLPETSMISSKTTSTITTLLDETSVKPDITSSPPEISKQSSTSTKEFSNITEETSSAVETTIIVEISTDTKIISLPTTVQDKVSTETVSPRATTLEKNVSMDIETTSSTPIVSNETEIFSARISTIVETTPFSVTDISSEELSTISNSETFSQTEITSTTASNRESTTTESPSREYTESSKDEKSHSIVPEITTKRTNNNETIQFECPKRFGLYPDPQSCSKFFHCSQWIAYHKTCSSKLHYNPELQVCDWPYRAGCGGSPVAPTSETIPPKEDVATLNETCDCECCFYPNKTDCSKYTLCLDGVLHRGQCAEGLLFNHLDHNCDIAERVTCLQTSSSCPTQNGVYPHPTLCTAFYKCVKGNPFLEHCSENKHFKASERKCADPCDADCDKTLSCNTSHALICFESDGLQPAEGDCSSYYQCVEDHAYFVRCPDGTHFNSEYGVCEPPCDARCDPTIDCPLPFQYANSKSLDLSSRHCTKPNGLIPAAEDCGAYYLCSEGRAHLLRCPPGLHYSIKDETCEAPCDARCDKSIDCTLIKTGKLKENFVPSFNLPWRLLCKTFDNGTLPNPKNCTSFYRCSEGKAHLLPCPRGLHFDPEDRECKSPCLAGCDSSIQCPIEIPIPKGKCSCDNCYLQDPTDCSAYQFCSQGILTKGYCLQGTLFDRSSNKCKNASEVVCEAIGDPAMCHEPSGNFPYPGNCNKFIRCEDSVAHVTDCVAGLEFNPVIRACANPKGYCDSPAKDSFCEETTSAHSKNSSLFYQCENGVKYLKSCSPPLIYNTLDQVCDWPHNVQGKLSEEILKTQDIKKDITKNVTPLSVYKKDVDSRNSDAMSCQEVPGVTCPCACRVTTYDDCNSFYHCRGDGRACKRRCPKGLHFNRKTLLCDLPRNVECREVFFATLRRLKSRNFAKTSLKSPRQAAH